MDKIKLYNDDCNKVIKTLKDKSIQFVLTDPPYIVATSGGGIIKNREYLNEIKEANIDTGFNIPDFLTSLIKLFESKEHYNSIFFCSKNQVLDYISWAKDNKLQYGIGVWHKTNPPPLCKGKYLNDVEYWIYIKGTASRINGEYKDKSLVYTSGINRKDKKLYNHPTIKPIEILEKFLTVHTSKNDIVFDPFLGSGSTAVACLNLDRKCVGVELDKLYFETAQKRIEDHLETLKGNDNGNESTEA